MAYRLLIVDDDPDFYRLVERELVDSAISISIDHAEDAVRARELIQSKDYDAWIVDCLLPGESGVDLLKHFKSKIAI
ncbi:MAG: response regulator, partial [Bdellovibrionaceae bacterium]|nr:response regulator [Pseudobdellovibrionaceae bacterium]